MYPKNQIFPVIMILRLEQKWVDINNKKTFVFWEPTFEL